MKFGRYKTFSVGGLIRECRLLALCRPSPSQVLHPLLSVGRTSAACGAMAAPDPQRTSAVGSAFLLEATCSKSTTMRSSLNLTTFRALVVLASATTFVASLIETAVVVDGSDRGLERLPFYGWELLVLGGLSVFGDVPSLLIWLANPILVIAWILYLRDRRRAALISAVTALGLTLCFVWVKSALGPGPEGVNVADFEMRPIISYGIGYWLWVASAAMLVAGIVAGNSVSYIVVE